MYGTQDWDLYFELLKRLLFAALCGIMIGWERDLHGRSAGLRTHMLVALGSAIFTLLSLLMPASALPSPGSENVRGDVGRIAAQIVSGIGFLGAGTIVKEGFTIKGLTTAACLWFSAAIGMACGANQIMIAFTMTIGELILVFIGKWYEKKMNRIFPFHLQVVGQNNEDMHQVFKFIKGEHDYARFSVMTQKINMDHGSKIVTGDFYVEGRFHESNAEHAFRLIKDINEKFPNIISISFKRNG
ncbi:MAG: MgtC/SapB family protein [Lentisphaeria bacterium]|nr:MgtC/SapB family protein [Lentisphaeria bacterium]